MAKVRLSISKRSYNQRHGTLISLTDIDPTLSVSAERSIINSSFFNSPRSLRLSLIVMKARASYFILSILAALPFVSAHGFVWQVTINGELYMGNVPNANPSPSIVRQINNVAPVKGANNTYLNCGQDAQNASQVASANPGDVLTFNWRGGDLSYVSAHPTSTSCSHKFTFFPVRNIIYSGPTTRAHLCGI